MIIIIFGKNLKVGPVGSQVIVSFKVVEADFFLHFHKAK
jgi:hypothetical protein